MEVLNKLDTPVFVTSWPGNADVLVVTERGSGLVNRYNGSIVGGPGGAGGGGGVPAQTCILDLSAKAHIADTVDVNVDLNGVTCAIFHPDFLNSNLRNRWIYARYNKVSTQETIVARYSIPTGTLTADVNTEEILFRAPTTMLSHASGQIHFDTLVPDGSRLYVALGDNTLPPSPANPPCNCNSALAQDSASKFGKLIVIDGNGGLDQPGTILGKGLRNPFGFSVDTGGAGLGDVWLGNTGADCAGDVFLWKAQTGGVENYGWPWKEGRCDVQDGTTPSFRDAACFTDPGCPDPGGNTYTKPVRVITDDLMTGSREALIGGLVYRAGAVTAFSNPDRYVFALFGAGGHPQVRSIEAGDPSKNAVTDDHSAALGVDLWPPTTLHGLGMDTDGRLYLIQVFAENALGAWIHENNGKIFRIE